MPTLAQDLEFVQAGLDELEAYLLSDTMYWALAEPASLPRLTLGSLLLGMMRLRARSNSTADSVQMIKLENRLDTIHAKCHTAWERKSRREALSRLELWKNYLLDYRQSPESQAELYPQQVQWRVLLNLHMLDSELLKEKVEFLAELDKMVKSSWIPGSFIWEPDLATAFPEPEYWFLYGKLKS